MEYFERIVIQHTANFPPLEIKIVQFFKLGKLFSPLVQKSVNSL